jgi:MFS family permease
MLRSSSPSGVRRVALARAVSQTGSSAAFAALNFVVYERTRSAAWVSAALLLTFGTVGLAGPIAGAIADRFDRRRVMIVSDLSAAVLFAAMGLVDSVTALIALAFAAALAETPFQAAAAAAIPDMTADDGLSRANGLVEVGGQVGFLLGPLLGGATLAARGSATVFVANSLSFALSALLCLSVRGRFQAIPQGEHHGAAAGMRLMAGDPMLRGVGLVYLGTVLGLGMTMVATVPLAGELGAGPSGYGALIAGWGAGSVAGALAGRRLTGRAEARAFLAGSSLVAVMTIAAGLASHLWWVAGALVLMGVGDGIASVGAIGVLQRRSPDAVRGRVVASLGMVMNLGLAVSYVAAASVVHLFGPRGTYVVGGVIAGLAIPFVIPTFRGERQPSAARVGPRTLGG